MPGLENFDIVYFMYTGEVSSQVLSENDSLISYMQYCPRLRKAGRITLPPSIYVVAIESWRNTESAQMFWVKTRHSTTAAHSKKIMEMLKETYKSVTIGEGCEAIPVKWFNGDIYTQYQPILHGGYYMSTHPTQCIHIADSLNATKIQVTVHRKTSGKMYSDICDILGTWRHGNRALNANYRFLPQRKRAEGAVHLLSRDLRDILIKNKSIKDKTIKLYNLVLMHDEKGNTIAQPVLQESLSPEDMTRIKKLNAALKKLPSHSIGDTYTIDGRLYPGVCVDATYDSGLWWMELADPAWE